jgi:hypothetical protein
MTPPEMNRSPVLTVTLRTICTGSPRRCQIRAPGTAATVLPAMSARVARREI